MTLPTKYKPDAILADFKNHARTSGSSFYLCLVV